MVLHVTLQMNGQSPVLQGQRKQIQIQMHGKKLHPQGDSPVLEKNKSRPCIKVHCLSTCFCMLSKTNGQL